VSPSNTARVLSCRKVTDLILNLFFRGKLSQLFALTILHVYAKILNFNFLRRGK